MGGSTTLRLIVVAALAGTTGLVNSGAAAARPGVDAQIRTGPAAVAALSTELRQFSAGTARIAIRHSTGNVTFVGASTAHPLQAGSGRDDDPGQTARRFVNRYGAMFGVADPSADLAQSAVVTSPHGDAVRFEQRFRGVPVLAGQVAVQIDSGGAVVSTTGEASPRLTVDVRPEIDPSAATASARAVTARADTIAPDALTVTTPELTVYDPALIDAPDPVGPRLVWKMQVENARGDVNRLVLVDAHTGAIAFEFSQVEHIDQDVCDNANIRGPEYCNSPVVFNGSESIDAHQAFTFAAQTDDFYNSVLGRNGIDGSGAKIVSTVRYCPPQSNPLQPCPYDNAFWNGEQMVYGEGWASADDVVGHELTHGVTQHTSGLLYYADAGAINESMSDVMGELVDQQTLDSADAQWLLGEDLPGGAIRSMLDPTLFNQPDTVSSGFFYTGLGDNRGVHENSGVGNHAAYLIAQATSNDTMARIYYEAETKLLGPGSDYSDLYNVLPQACTNLIGTTAGIVANDCQQGVNAVNATAMNLHPAGSGYFKTAPVCDSGVQNALELHDDTTSIGPWVGTTTGGGASWGLFDDVSATGGKTLHVLDAAAPAGTSTLTGQTPIAIPSGTTFLRFDHSYNTDWDGGGLYDGGVVEYSADGGSTWSDLGPLAVNNGYDATISTANENGVVSALGARNAFGRISPNFETSRFDLSSLAGQTIRLRFTFATDNYPNLVFDGWFIDDISVYSCGSANLPGPPTSVSAAPGTASAVVTWAAPAFTGGSAITGYRITPFVNGSAQAPVDTTDASGSGIVPNLLGTTSYRFTVAARNANGLGPASALSAPVSPPSDFSSLVPARLLETRQGRTTVDGAFNGLGLRGAGTITALTVNGRGNVANDAAAVALNVTVTEAQAAGFLTVYPCGGDPPNSSSLNYVAGSTVPNAVVSKVGVNGQVCFFTQSPIQLVVDTNGFFGPTSSLVPLVPARLLDSRQGAPTFDGQSTGIGLRAAGSFTQVQVTGRAGVPSDASAAVLNVTVTGAQAPGYATVYPCGSTPPTASNLNYVAGATVPNAAVAKIGKAGRVCVFTQSPIHLVVDVVGYFPATAVFSPLVPARLLETRPGQPTFDGQGQGGGARPAGSVTQVQVIGRASIPASATAVAINVTITAAQAPGFATVYPCGDSPPNASNLNYLAGSTVANLVLAKLGPGGTVCVFTQSAADIIVDVNGYFAG
jgi:bacillolysin